MLAKLTMELSGEECGLSYQKSSLLQGVLMEHIEPEYAERLHETGLKPYSQCLYLRDRKYYWEINSLDQTAYDGIVNPLLDSSFTGFYLEHNDAEVRIKGKSLKTKSYQELVEDYYFGDTGRRIDMSFLTPTAFRQNGRYVFYPDIRLIYQSLMNRFDTFSPDQAIKSDETLEQLVDYTEISRYSLHSTRYFLEGVKIPAFTGSIGLWIHGPDPMVHLAWLLFRYGEYAGVGIKTAIGMGCMEIEERRGSFDRQRD